MQSFLPLLSRSASAVRTGGRHRALQPLWPASLAAVVLVCGAAVYGSAQQSASPAPQAAPAAPVTASPPPQTPAPAAAETPAASPAPQATPQAAPPPAVGEITEQELRSLLIGKPLYLRNGYLGDSLAYNEHGEPTGHPGKSSYTLSAVQIEKVRLSKHKIELEGARYGLHFLGAMPYEDPATAVDRVKITPKKKTLKITIDREIVVKPKKIAPPKAKAASKPAGNPGTPAKPAGAPPTAAPANPAAAPVVSSETDSAAATPPLPSAPAPQTPPAQATAQASAPAAAESAPTEAAPAETAAAEPPEKPEDQAADQASVTTTTSPAHASKVLRDAIDHVFAQGLDEKARAEMAPFWQLYYQAQANGIDYHSRDPKVVRSSAVDQQAKLVSSITPDSNEYAQASGIAGRALYRAVIGSDGKPGEIAVVRPIGFGLDENAVAAIRKATFQPAIKDGQPVAESLDLAVLFRIYSKRTSVAAPVDAKAAPAEVIRPGPYSVNHPAASLQPAPDAAPNPAPDPASSPAPDATPNPAPKPQ